MWQFFKISIIRMLNALQNIFFVVRVKKDEQTGKFEGKTTEVYLKRKALAV